MEWLNLLNRLAAKRVKLKESKLKESEDLVETTSDISEPVISFLKVFESNPRRFKIKYTKTSAHDACGGYRAFELTDTYTKERFPYLSRWFYNYEEGLYGIKDLPNFLTLDEQKLIIKTIRNYYVERGIRLRYLKSIRTKRKQANERKRLTKIYREG